MSDVHFHDNYAIETEYGFLQSNVSGARLAGNRIITDQSPPPTNIFGVYEKGDHNTNNVFQDNAFSNSLLISLISRNCAYGNVNQSGARLQGLGDTQKTPCVAGSRMDNEAEWGSRSNAVVSP